MVESERATACTDVYVPEAGLNVGAVAVGFCGGVVALPPPPQPTIRKQLRKLASIALRIVLDSPYGASYSSKSLGWLESGPDDPSVSAADSR